MPWGNKENRLKGIGAWKNERNQDFQLEQLETAVIRGHGGAVAGTGWGAGK